MGSQNVDSGKPTSEDELMTNEPVHIAEWDTPMEPGYVYDSTGTGVRPDLVDAVLAKWASIAPTGDPADPLRSVNQGAINQVDNIARMAVSATLEKLGLVPDSDE
jgi:hypothetical protein